MALLADTRSDQPVFVGRRRELRRPRADLQQTMRGRGAMFLVTGEARNASGAEAMLDGQFHKERENRSTCVHRDARNSRPALPSAKSESRTDETGRRYSCSQDQRTRISDVQLCPVIQSCPDRVMRHSVDSCDRREPTNRNRSQSADRRCGPALHPLRLVRNRLRTTSVAGSEFPSRPGVGHAPITARSAEINTANLRTLFLSAGRVM